jgi:hypothetical protein
MSSSVSKPTKAPTTSWRTNLRISVRDIKHWPFHEFCICKESFRRHMYLSGWSMAMSSAAITSRSPLCTSITMSHQFSVSELWYGMHTTKITFNTSGIQAMREVPFIWLVSFHWFLVPRRGGGSLRR